MTQLLLHLFYAPIIINKIFKNTISELCISLLMPIRRSWSNIFHTMKKIKNTNAEYIYLSYDLPYEYAASINMILL